MNDTSRSTKYKSTFSGHVSITGLFPTAHIIDPCIIVTSTFLIGILHIFLITKLAWSDPGNRTSRARDQGSESQSEIDCPETDQLYSGSRGIPMCQFH